MLKIILTNFFLGIGLAMDACAVSMANGLKEPKMKVRKVLLIASMFGIFQGIMPLIGYFVGHTFVEYIEKFIPWIALILLGLIGGKMLYDGIKKKSETDDIKVLTFKVLLLQAFATSIDALSVGLTIADYQIIEAIISALIIANVTFGISIGGLNIGKVFGTKLSNKAEILGGIILILIGIEIFITGMWLK